MVYISEIVKTTKCPSCKALPSEPCRTHRLGRLHIIHGNPGPHNARRRAYHKRNEEK